MRGPQFFSCTGFSGTLEQVTTELRTWHLRCKDLLGHGSISLNLEETLIAFSISSTTNPTAQQATQQLPKLSGRELHLTHLPTPGDERGLRRLGVNLACDPSFASDKLFVS